MFRLQVTIIRQTFEYMELKHVANFTLLNIWLCFDWMIILVGTTAQRDGSYKIYIYIMLYVGN